jgi:hypothetical protein
MEGPLRSREYKVMLDHRLFADRKAAAASFWRELKRCGRRFDDMRLEGEFDATQKRSIVFLDTPDATIRKNGFVFRQRADLEQEKTHYTLKCRSPDFFVARGARVEAAAGMNGEGKFEEDIGAPYVSRYSQSTTVEGPAKAPKNLKQAAALFTSLGELVYDGEQCSLETKLRSTHSVALFERVLTGPVLKLGKVDAEAALILWSDGPDGRPLVAECSYRYKTRHAEESSRVAALAMRLFLAMQRLDWCLPEARTKTAYAYQELEPL